jgi:hypothetical protein
MSTRRLKMISPEDPGWPELKERVRQELWGLASSGGRQGYEEFASTIEGVSARSSHFHRMLDQIDRDEHAQQRRLLSAVVARAGRYGMPGEGFFICARDLGYAVDDQRAFWKAELEHVHDQASGKPCPPLD